jgi:hypothetical protein
MMLAVHPAARRKGRLGIGGRGHQRRNQRRTECDQQRDGKDSAEHG